MTYDSFDPDTDGTVNSDVDNTSTSSSTGSFTDELSIPTYSDDSAAPSGSTYYHTGHETVKYKDSGGTVHSGHNVVHVDDFGAVGDGTTDDSAAIQAAVDSVPSGEHAILKFSPGKKYLIQTTVTIPVKKFRIIDGCNAHIILDSDIVALECYGNKTQSGSNPEAGDNRTHAEEEMGTIIRGIQAYSNTSTYYGTPILIRNTTGTVVAECQLAMVKNGIEISDINRNIGFTNNHIWDFRGYGLFFNGGDLHQCYITANFLAWGRRLIRIVDGDFADFIITGNDLEAGNYEQDGSDVIIDLEINDAAFNMYDFKVTGNAIDGHNETNKGIRVNGTMADDRNVTDIQIIGNYIAQHATCGIEIRGLQAVVINSNTLYRNPQAIDSGGQTYGVTISSNVFQQGRVDEVGHGINHTTDDLVIGWSISNNVFNDWIGRAIEINDSSTSVNNRSEISIVNNIVNIKYNTGLTISGPLINLGTYSGYNNVIVSGNLLRGRDIGEDGLRAQAAGGYTNTIITNNMVRGITNGFTYEVADGTLDGVIVENNLANGKKVGAANYFFQQSTQPNNPQAGAVWIDTS